VDVQAGTAAVVLNQRKVGAVVPARIVAVIIRHGIEALRTCGSGGDKHVGHAHDRGGIHTAAQFGEDRLIGIEPASDGIREDRSKILYVLEIFRIADGFAWRKVPILAKTLVAFSYDDERRRG